MVFVCYTFEDMLEEFLFARSCWQLDEISTPNASFPASKPGCKEAYTQPWRGKKLHLQPKNGQWITGFGKGAGDTLVVTLDESLHAMLQTALHPQDPIQKSLETLKTLPHLLPKREDLETLVLAILMEVRLFGKQHHLTPKHDLTSEVQLQESFVLAKQIQQMSQSEGPERVILSKMPAWFSLCFQEETWQIGDLLEEIQNKPPQHQAGLLRTHLMPWHSFVENLENLHARHCHAILFAGASWKEGQQNIDFTAVLSKLPATVALSCSYAISSGMEIKEPGLLWKLLSQQENSTLHKVKKDFSPKPFSSTCQRPLYGKIHSPWHYSLFDTRCLQESPASFFAKHVLMLEMQKPPQKLFSPEKAFSQMLRRLTSIYGTKEELETLINIPMQLESALLLLWEKERQLGETLAQEAKGSMEKSQWFYQQRLAPSLRAFFTSLLQEEDMVKITFFEKHTFVFGFGEISAQIPVRVHYSNGDMGIYAVELYDKTKKDFTEQKDLSLAILALCAQQQQAPKGALHTLGCIFLNKEKNLPIKEVICAGPQQVNDYMEKAKASLLSFFATRAQSSYDWSQEIAEELQRSENTALKTLFGSLVEKQF